MRKLIFLAAVLAAFAFVAYVGSRVLRIADHAAAADAAADAQVEALIKRR